jgi:hypothetical protein
MRSGSDPLDIVVRGFSDACALVWRKPEAVTAFREAQSQGLGALLVPFILAPIYFAAIFAMPRLVGDLGNLGVARIDAATLALLTTIALCLSFVIYPMIVRPFVSRTPAQQRLGGYVAALNWTSVLVALVVAGPLVLYAMTLIDAPIAAAASVASAVVAIELRYFLATQVLGVDGGLAGVLVALDLGLQATLVQFALVLSIVLMR